MSYIDEIEERLWSYDMGEISEKELAMVLTPGTLGELAALRDAEIKRINNLVIDLTGRILERGMTVNNLSRESGVSTDRIYRWLNHYRKEQWKE